MGLMGSPREHFLRFLRFLRNDLGVKTSYWWSRWLDQAKDAHAQSKSSTKLLSLYSTQPHKRKLPTNSSLPPQRGQPVCRGSCKSSPQAESRVHYSCARSVRSATRRQLSVPQLALRAYPDDRLEDRGGARPRFVERVHLRGPIITIPITLYGYGNGDAEEGVPSDGAMGREHERDKVGRCSRLVRPLGDRKRDMLQLQSLAHHAHQVLAQPVQVGLLAQEPRR